MFMGLLLAVNNVWNGHGCQLHTFVVYTLIVGMLVVFGIIGNSLTFAVFWKGNFKSSTSFLFMCLALTDSAALLTAFLVFSIHPVFAYMGYQEILYPYNIDSLIGLHVFASFTYFVSHTATMWMTVLIAINRYIIVCRPLRASQWCTDSRVKKQVAAVLVLAVLYNIAIGAGLVLRQDIECAMLPIYILDVICSLIMPICILALLNIRLIQALNTHRRMQIQNRSIQKDNATTFVLVVVIVVVIICQLPQLFSVFLQQSWCTNRITLSSFGIYIEQISVTLIVLNSAVNFIIYIICNKRFRAVLIEKVFKRNAPQQEPIAHHMAVVENGEPVNETRI